MGKYFGTDGVRGIANTELTPELAFKLGRAGGCAIAKDVQRPKILVGRDTRISGEMLEAALIAGLLSIGAEVLRLGVLSTPAVAYLTKAMDAHAGIMISASHNPVEDNGIKFFSSNGFKLTDEQEESIEELIDHSQEIPRPVGADVGSVGDYFEGKQKYMQFLKQTVEEEDFSDLHIALDCANGATSALAPHLFADLEAEITTIGTNPNGININDGVGSTHPETLADHVKTQGADIGLAFDGDGDRLIAVDENGAIVDGDKIMYVCAKHLNEQGQLKDHTLVTTVMSNIGLYKALDTTGIVTKKTAVGDRYVMEEMRENGFTLGGEQSGHIIFLNHTTTGDGMLSALQLVNIIKSTGKSLSELVAEVVSFPQKLVNIQVVDKHQVKENPRVAEVIQAVEAELSDDGRVLVRSSGTESLVRVMVEAPTEEDCDRYVAKIAHVINEELGNN